MAPHLVPVAAIRNGEGRINRRLDLRQSNIASPAAPLQTPCSQNPVLEQPVALYCIDADTNPAEPKDIVGERSLARKRG